MVHQSAVAGRGRSTWSDRSRNSSAERQINRGRMPERPFVLVGQQYLADPSRSAGDASGLDLRARAERLRGGRKRGDPRPGREIRPGLSRPGRRVLGSIPADLAAYNPNYVGGDIIAGANTPWQVLIRPRLA